MTAAMMAAIISTWASLCSPPSASAPHGWLMIDIFESPSYIGTGIKCMGDV